MQLEALKIFCDVVRYHSFSKGAEVNEVTQSAASQAIHQLEKRLGVPLIDRSCRPWVLTDEGRIYYEQCQELVERYEQIEAEIRALQRKPAYLVRVAAIYSVGFQDMGRYVDAFRRALPGSDVEIEYVHPDVVYERIAEGEADLGLVSFPQASRDLEVIPWRREPMVIACLPAHRFARETSLPPSALEGEPFVAFERGLVIRREIDRYLRKNNVSVEIVMELDNIETIKRAVEDGLGITILPAPTLTKETKAGVLAAIPLSGTPFERPLCVLHRRRRRLNPAVARFVRLLTEGTERSTSETTGAASAG